jgi:transposase-like protein
MEEVKSCAKCNKMFSSRNGATFCEVCARDEDEIYKNIREYLVDHPGTSIMDLSVRFKVSINRLMHYVHNGRFDLVPPGRGGDGNG